MRQAKIDDIARRVLARHSLSEIAVEMDVTEATVRNLIQSKDFQASYSMVREEFYDNLDQIIRDERAKPLFRMNAQAIRAQSALTDTMELIHERVIERTAKATEMRTLMDVAFGIIDRSQSEISMVKRGETNVQVNILDLPQKHVDLMKGTIEESGLNIADIIDAEVVDVPTSDNNA